MGKVIVIGCHVGGLAVIRSLGRQHQHVIALTHNSLDFAQTSRYVAERANCPDPSDETAFIDFLLDHADRWKEALILETGDYHAVALAKHKAELSPHYRIVTPGWDTLRHFVEKEATYALAETCGVPHPRTWTPACVDDLEPLRLDDVHPCVLKPVRSHEFVSVFKTKGFQVSTFDELVDKFRLCRDAGQPVIVQEVIPGTDDASFERVQVYIDSRGNTSAMFFNSKIRQNPPGFGVMRVGISVLRNPEVEELTCRLLDRANFRGYCSVEYKRDPRDGQLKLIEVNARMPRSGWLAIASGVDFPWLIYQDLVLDQPAAVEHYTENLYLIEFWADVLNFLLRDRQRIGRMRDYARPYLARRKAFAVLSWHDPRPFFKQTALLPATIRRQKLRQS